jgi:hypothetical protein
MAEDDKVLFFSKNCCTSHDSRIGEYSFCEAVKVDVAESEIENYKNQHLSFVYSSENNDREGLVESIKLFFMSMKKRDDNPIENLVLEDLKETAEGLYRHLMKGDTKNEDLVAEKITQDINQHFSGGYNIIWNDTLNHFLVDFDIIRILKNHIGYNSWSDVPMDQRELCYRGYNRKNTLPDWNVEQEGY